MLAMIQTNINKDSGCCMKVPKSLLVITVYIHEISFMDVLKLRENNKHATDKNSRMLIITEDIMATVLKFFFSANTGIIKYKNVKELKANIFDKPPIKVSKAPYPNIGKILCHTILGKAEVKVIIKEPIINKTMKTLDLKIAFSPNKFETQVVIIKNINK